MPFPFTVRVVWCGALLIVSAHVMSSSGGVTNSAPPKVWESLNPGFGGNVQSVFLDPFVQGRMFMCSDMEGLYVSRDYGDSWDYIGHDLSFSYVNTVATSPDSTNRLYAGTEYSLELSDDAGGHWRRVPGICDSIGQIAIEPSGGRRMLALPGQRYRWGRPFEEDRADVAAGRRRGPFGDRDFYVSSDRGASWTRHRYADGVGRRDVFSCDFQLGRPGTIYLGTVTGVYRSYDSGETWSLIVAPEGTGDCLGAALSPDGAVLYAAFRVSSGGRPAIRTTTGEQDLGREGYSHLFAMRTTETRWYNLSAGQSGFELSPQGHTMFWRPRVDPRSSPEAHRLLMGTYRPQHGLWRVAVSWRGSEPTGVEWRRDLYYDSAQPGFTRESVPFDFGWERWGIMAEDYHFSPLSWIARPCVFSSGGQTLFRVPVDRLDSMAAWEPVYTRRKEWLEGVPTYRTRGADCMFVFCADAYRNYAVQSVADNCLLESWDGGFSWSQDTKPGVRNTSRSNASLIIRDLNPPLVVAHIAVGWGAAERPGALWAKRLVDYSPKDRWVMIAGGEEERLAGLPGGTYNQLVSDPHCPRRLYVGCAFNEVYVIEDVEALYEAAIRGDPLPQVTSITKGMPPPRPRHVTYDSTGLAVDPFNAGIVYVADNNKLWRGTTDAERRSWSWKPVLDDNGDTRFAAWAMNGKTCLVAARHDPGGGDDRMVWSLDRGETWQPLLGSDALRKARQPPAWYEAGVPLVAAGITGYGDHLFLSYVTPRKYGRRPYGEFGVRLDLRGVVTVEDLTADAHWPYAVKAKVRPMGDGLYLYLCSRGNGLWRRPVTVGKELAP